MAGPIEELALLTDAEINKVLNRVIEGYAARNPDIPIGDPQALTAILSQAGAKLDQSVVPREDSKLTNRAQAERELLVQLARIPEQQAFVQGAIDNSRKVLIEPVTTALIMAGLILVLQTKFDIKVSRKNGKTNFEVNVGKKPTDASLIKKIFSIFS